MANKIRYSFAYMYSMGCFILLGALFFTLLFLHVSTKVPIESDYLLVVGVPAVIVGFIWMICIAAHDAHVSCDNLDNMRTHILNGLGEISGEQAKQARITLHDMDYTKGFESCKTEIKTIAEIFNISLDKT